jgi:ABC-type glycerol-3-phosphate transport system substrate-binding protein
VTVPYELPSTLVLLGHFEPETQHPLDRHVASFEERNPDARVAVLEASENSSARRQSFAESLAAGDIDTDLFALEAEWVAEFASQEWLLSLDPYVPKEASHGKELVLEAAQIRSSDGSLVALSPKCLPDQWIAISNHSPQPERAFRFLVALLDCLP